MVAIGVSVLIFLVFVAYAFLSRASYRTTALLIVEGSGGAAGALPTPLEAARRLHEAVLGQEMMERVAKEIRAAEGADPEVSIASTIRDSLQIDTIDSRVFSVSFRDSEPTRAQSVCNLLAKAAVSRAPSVLFAAGGDQSLQERDRQLADALAFLSAHPEVGARAGKPDGDKDDTALAALRSERIRLSELLSARGAKSDNPYTNPSKPELTPDRIQRRIAEIDGVMAARKRALEKPVEAPNAGLELEWHRKLQVLLAAPPNVLPAPEANPLRARLLAEAAVPTTPVEPNRKLVLLIGVLVALGVFGVVVIVRPASRRSSRGQRAHSMRSQEAVRVEAVNLPGADGAPARTDPLTSTLQLPPGDQFVVPQRSQPPPEVTEAAVTTPPLPLLGATPGDGAESAPPVAEPPRVESAGYPSPLPPPEDPALAETAVSVPPPVAIQPPSPVVTEAARPAGSILPRAVIEINAAARLNADGGSTHRDVAPLQRAAASPGPQRLFADEQPPRVTVEERPRAEDRPRPAEDRPRPAEDRPRPAEDRPRRGPTRVTQVLGSPIELFGDALNGQPQRIEEVAPARPVVQSPAAGFPSVSPVSPARRARNSDPPAAAIAAYDVSGSWHPEPTLVPGSHRLLRDELLPLSRGRGFVLGISSTAGASERKSRLSAELALALSERAGSRVLIVEGDFQRPSVHRFMRVTPSFSAGFSQQLQARSRAKGSGWQVMRCASSLDVLAEGAMRAPGMMLTPEFAECIAELRNHYDFVIIDAPPLTFDAECRVLDRLLDGLAIAAKRPDEPGLDRAGALFSAKTWSKLVAVT